MIVSILNPPHEKTDCKITKAVNRYTTLLYKWLNNYCCIDIKKMQKFEMMFIWIKNRLKWGLFQF